MPIKLITGLPGHGKTCFLVNELLKREKEKDQRLLYICGIEFTRKLDLNYKIITRNDLENWQQFEDGSEIIVDEAQESFPQRTKGEAPKYITGLSKHRHKGLDFIFLTQDPRLLDAWARRNCAEHRHIKRLFGTRIQAVFTWADKAVDNPRDGKEQRTAITNINLIGKKSWGVYKSASNHTIKSNVPFKVKFVFFMFIVVPVVAYTFSDNITSFGSRAEENKNSLTRQFSVKENKKLTVISNTEPNPQIDESLFINQRFKYYGYFKILNNSDYVDGLDLKMILEDGSIINLTVDDLDTEDNLTFLIPSPNKLILEQNGIKKVLYRIVSKERKTASNRINLPF